MKEKTVFFALAFAVFLSGCGMFAPAPSDNTTNDYNYDFLDNTEEPLNEVPEENKLNLVFSEGQTEFDSKVSVPHWKITSIEFFAETNENKVLEAVIEVFDEQKNPASSSVSEYVNLVKGKQKVSLSQLGLGIEKRGQYTIKISFYDGQQPVKEYSFESVIGATGIPVKKEVLLEVTDFEPKQKEFNFECSTYIGFDHKIKITNTGNTELFGKTVSEAYLNREKMKVYEKTGFSLFLEYPENEDSISVDDSIAKDNSCYFGQTVKLVVKFIDDEGTVVTEKTLEKAIIKDV